MITKNVLLDIHILVDLNEISDYSMIGQRVMMHNDTELKNKCRLFCSC
jgi:hypothetical protein